MNSPLAPLPKIKPGIYRHYKGNDYQVIDTCFHSETLEEMMLYRALYGEHALWVRPYAMFIENVTVDGKTMPRFKWLSEAGGI